MVMEQERILAEGKLYKFKTQPIDPTDPFRGSYLVLRFEANQFSIDTVTKFSPQEQIFVSLENDGNGFAKVTGISKEKPVEKDYLIAKVSYSNSYNKDGKQTIWIDYPFEKFYVEESKASKAERIYWKANRDSSQTAYALIKVRDGRSAIADLIINEKSIHEILKSINVQK
jgi:uncharacterized membrane-anchored protein